MTRPDEGAGRSVISDVNGSNNSQSSNEFSLDDVSINATTIYFGKQSLDIAINSISDLDRYLPTDSAYDDVELDMSLLTDAKARVANAMAKMNNDLKPRVMQLYDMLAEDPNIAILFACYDEDMLAIDGFSLGEDNESTTLAAMQNDLLSQLDKYDEVINSNVARMAEIEEAAKRNNSNTENGYGEEYDQLVRDTAAIKWARDNIFTQACMMYTKMPDFETKSRNGITILGETDGVSFFSLDYDGPKNLNSVSIRLAGETTNGQIIDDPMQVAIYLLNHPQSLTLSGDLKTYKEEIVGYLTDEEIGVLTYLYNTGNNDRYQEFIKRMQDETAKRHGLQMAQEIIDQLETYRRWYEEGFVDGYNEHDNGELSRTTYIGDDLFRDVALTLAGTGIKDGLTQSAEGIKNFFYGDGIRSANEYKSMLILQYLESTYDKDSFMGIMTKAAYEIPTSIGNMMPSIALSFIPIIGQAAGLTYMGMSAAGNAKEQALQLGLDYDSAVLYGFFSGLSEVGLEYLFGGICKLASGKTPETLMKTFGIPKLLSEMISEGGEESLQSILDPFFLYVASNGQIPFELDWEDVIKSGVYGFVTAGIINTGMTGLVSTAQFAGKGIPLLINGIQYDVEKSKLTEIIDEFKDANLEDPKIREQFEKRLLENSQYAKFIENIEDVTLENLEEFYDRLSGKSPTSGRTLFGVDQKIFPKLTSAKDNNAEAAKEYDRLYKKLLNQGFSEVDAARVLSNVGATHGICTYAATCAGIFAYYKNKPLQFERDFGYKMYTVVDGEIVLNSAELQLDMYTHVNNTAHGGYIFITNGNTTTINADFIYAVGTMEYGNGINISAIDSFLKSKNPYLSIRSNQVYSLRRDCVYPVDNQVLDEKQFLRYITDSLSNGKSNFSLTIYPYSPIELISLTPGVNNFYYGGANGGHSVDVVGVTHEGFIISSWGARYLVTFDEIYNAPGTVELIDWSLMHSNTEELITRDLSAVWQAQLRAYGNDYDRALSALQRYLDTGNIDSITKDSNARALLLQYSIDELRQFVLYKNNNSLDLRSLIPWSLN